MEQFGDRLRRVLKARGLEGQEFAPSVGVHKGTVSRWLTGAKVPVPDKRRFIEQVLELPAGYLDGGEATDEVPPPVAPVVPSDIPPAVFTEVNTRFARAVHELQRRQRQGMVTHELALSLLADCTQPVLYPDAPATEAGEGEDTGGAETSPAQRSVR